MSVWASPQAALPDELGDCSSGRALAWKSAWLLLAVVLSEGGPLAAAQQPDPSTIADRLLVDGWLAPGVADALLPCTDENPVLSEIFSRELDDQQTQGLAQTLSGPWERCPSAQIDAWLVAELTERLSHPDRPAPVCSIDCPGYLVSGAERALWLALESRRPPNALELWMDVARSAPSSLVEGHAWVAAAQPLPELERIAFFLENYERPDLPGFYSAGHASSLARPFIRHVDAGRLVELAHVPAARSLLIGIARLATRAEHASPALADSAFVLLDEALSLSAPGPRRDHLRELVENARIERLLPEMTTGERIDFYVQWLRTDPPPLPYQSAEPYRLLALDSSEFLARLSADLFIDGADHAGDGPLIFALGWVAGWPPGTSLADSVRAMSLLEEARVLGRTGPRARQIERAIENALMRRVEHGFPG